MRLMVVASFVRQPRGDTEFAACGSTAIAADAQQSIALAHAFANRIVVDRCRQLVVWPRFLSSSVVDHACGAA